MDIENLKEFEDNILNDADFFDKFIKECEAGIIAAPENFVSSVMTKINEAQPVKVIPFISRKMRAAICFSSAFAIMAMTLFGVNNKISDFISTVVTPEKINKIGELLNIISKFK